MFEADKTYNTAADDTSLPHDPDLSSSTLIMYCVTWTTYLLSAFCGYTSLIWLIDWARFNVPPNTLWVILGTSFYVLGQMTWPPVSKHWRKIGH